MAETIHRRALFFELYASTRIFERQVKSASNIFKQMAQDFKGIFAGIEGDATKAYQKMAAASTAAMQKMAADEEARAAKARATSDKRVADAETAYRKDTSNAAMSYAVDVANYEAAAKKKADKANKIAQQITDDQQLQYARDSAAVELNEARKAEQIEAYAQQRIKTIQSEYDTYIATGEKKVTAAKQAEDKITAELAAATQTRIALEAAMATGSFGSLTTPTDIAAMSAAITDLESKRARVSAARGGAVTGGRTQEALDLGNAEKNIDLEIDEIRKRITIAQATGVMNERAQLTVLMQRRREEETLLAKQEEAQARTAAVSLGTALGAGPAGVSAQDAVAEARAAADAMKTIYASESAERIAGLRAAAEVQVAQAELAAAAEKRVIGQAVVDQVVQRMKAGEASVAEYTMVREAAEADARYEEAMTARVAEAQMAAAKAAADVRIAEARRAAQEESAPTGLGGVLSVAGDVGKVAIPVVAGLTLALGGLFAMLDHVTMSAAAYGMQVLQMASVTGLTTNYFQSQGKEIKNTTFDLQVYTDLFGYFGVSAEKVQTIFVRLNKTIAEHPERLTAIGVSARDAGGVLRQLSDAVVKTTNDTQKMSLVEAALGGNLRGTIEPVTAIMNLSNAGIQRYADNMVKLGLIMDDDQVKASAVTDAIHGQMDLALKGLERTVGQALFPTMNALFLMITSGAEGAKGAFSSIAQAVANVLGAVVGFFYGVFGGTQEQLHRLIEDAKAQSKAAADLAAGQHNSEITAAQDKENALKQIAALQDADQRLNDQKTANSQRNTDAQKALTDQIDNQTKAIDAQIKTINDASAEFVQGENAKINALEHTKTNLDDQQKIEDDLGTSVLAMLQAESDAITDTNERRRKGNENLYDYQIRLHQIDLKDQITAEQTKRKTVNDTLQQQIDQQRQATQEAIQANADQVKSQVDALTTQKKNLADYLKDRKDAMDLALQQENNAITRQVRANEALVKELQKKTTQSFDDTASSATVNASDIEKTFDSMWTTLEGGATIGGVNVGNNFRNAIGDLFSGKASLIDDIADLGVRLGSSMADGIMHFLGKQSTALKIAKTLSDGIEKVVTIVPGLSQILGGLLTAGTDRLLDRAIQDAEASEAGMTWFKSPTAGAPVSYGGIATHVAQKAEGGITTAPTLSWLSERNHREVVIPYDDHPRARQLMAQTGLDRLGGGGGGTTLVANYNGPVADTLVASRVMGRMQTEARRRGLVRQGGMS